MLEYQVIFVKHIMQQTNKKSFDSYFKEKAKNFRRIRESNIKTHTHKI